MKIRYRLRTKLIISYIALAAFVIIAVSLFVDFSINRGFEKYVIEKHNKYVEAIMSDLVYSYENSNGFNLDDIMRLGVDAIEKGLIIELVDSNNQKVWSATEHNSGLCETMISNIRENMFTYYSSWRGDYTEETHLLKTDSNPFAKLTIGYLGPYYFNEEELFFLTNINDILIKVGLVALLLSIIIGILIARSITYPIEKVVSHLNLIDSNKKSNVLSIQTNSTEIQSLYEGTLHLENRIREQEILRKQLTQDMAHELKTPLTSVQGILEAMMDGLFPLTIDRLHSCLEEIIRIKNLIHEIEVLYAEENNIAKLHYQVTDIIELIEKTAGHFEQRLRENKQTIQILEKGSVHRDLLHRFPCDPFKIKQVFINLIDNSIKYAGKGTNILIQFEVLTSKHLKITYSDNGQGVPAEEASYIFERFYRIDHSRTGNNGLGIGLTLSKAVIEKHKGTIEIDSEFEKGILFKIELPFLETYESSK